MTFSTEIAVLGAGPAAIATACGLRELGHDAVSIGVSRNVAVEGVSERTLTLMRECRLRAAADSVCGPGERVGHWGGAELAGSREYLVDRAEFDRALLDDACSNGVSVRTERVSGYERLGSIWRVYTDRGLVDCRVVVDARGRRAQRVLCKGPDLIAVCQRFRTRPAGRVLTRLEAVPQGWCWLATNACGMSWLQVISGREEPSLRSGLERHLGCLLAAAPAVAAALSGATPQGAPLARAASAILSVHRDVAGVFHVGDAVVALDPLSGQGMYEALRSAAVTVAAAHSFLSTGEWDPIARFIGERAQELWQRRSATAALHYGRQAEKTPSAFWRQAASRYRSIRPEPPTRPHGACMDWRPVLNGSLIQLRRVVITPQSPRGVWRVDGLDLPELVDFLDSAHTRDVELAARQLSCSPAAVAHAMQWLSAHGLLPPRGTGAPQAPGAG